MQTALIVSNSLLWIVIIILLIVVYALARQIGILHERVAPVGALMPTEGPKIGEIVKPLKLETIDNNPIDIGGEKAFKTLIYFISPTCPICKSLLPVVLSLDKHEGDKLQIVFASDGEDEKAHINYAKDHQLENYPYVVSQTLGMQMGVNKLPFAVLINEQGVLRGRGLVNSREHLESLLQADELNISSLQEYLGVTENG